MAFGKGKKESPDRDKYGSKNMPYMTNEQSMNAYGIKPIRGRKATSSNVVRKIIMFSSISLVILLFFSAIVGLKSSGKVESLRGSVEENYSPAFKSRYDSLGASIIESYFAQKTPPVNLLQEANWPGVSGGNTTDSAPVEVQGLSLIRAYQTPYSIQGESNKADKQIFKNPRNEILQYSGVINGRQYEFGVYLVVPDIDDSKQLPYLVSPPTIMPMKKLVNAGIDGSHPSGEEFEEAELNEGTLKNLSRWASAYAQGDSDTLKSLTGDGRVEATYPGVGGFTLNGDPEVQWAYEFTDVTTNKQRIVARVTFTMSSDSIQASNDDENIAGSSNSGVFAPRQVMDILLGNFEEGSADIIAWGPGGMWQTLEPRMNAVVPIVMDDDGNDASGDAINPTDDAEATDGSDGSTDTTESTASEENSVPGAPTLTDRSETTSEKNIDDEDEESEETTTSKKSKGSKGSKSKTKGSTTKSKKSSKTKSSKSHKRTESQRP